MFAFNQATAGNRAVEVFVFKFAVCEFVVIVKYFDLVIGNDQMINLTGVLVVSALSVEYLL